MAAVSREVAAAVSREAAAATPGPSDQFWTYRRASSKTSPMRLRSNFVKADRSTAGFRQDH